MKPFSLAAFLVGSLATMSVVAADWKYITADDQGGPFYYDASSIIHLKNGHLQVWSKNETRKDLQQKLGTGALYLEEIDCAGRRFKTLDVQPIDNSLENLKRVSVDRKLVLDGRWNNFTPVDFDEKRLHALCGTK